METCYKVFRGEILRSMRLQTRRFGFEPEITAYIAKFSLRDAESYPKYEAMLERVAAVIEPTLPMIPPNIIRPGLGDLWKLFQLSRSV